MSELIQGEVVDQRTPDQWAAVVRADLARAVEGMVAAGLHLIQAKPEVGHGNFETWVRQDVGISPGWARKLMQVAQNDVLANRSHGSVLPADSHALYELSRLDPPALLTQAIEAGQIAPDLGRDGAAALVERLQRAAREAEAADQAGDLPAGPYSTIVADPPWAYENVATRGAAEDHYLTMSVDDICKLDVEGSADDGAHLYLWVTNGFLREGFEVLEAWGFEYKTCLTWVKPQIGLGNYFRSATEHVLFGVRGSLPIADRGLANWFQAMREKHSAKPEVFYELVERASPGPYLEMFSRRDRGGWDAWGFEA